MANKSKLTPESGKGGGIADAGKPNGGGGAPPLTADDKRPPFRPAGGAAATPKDASARVSVPLTADGKIDFDSMRPATIEKIKAAMKDGAAKTKLGLTRSAEGGAPLIKPESTAPLFLIAGGIESLLVSLVGKIPRPVATAIMTYNDAEFKELSPDVAQVVSEHGPAWMIRWLSEAGEGSSARLFTKLAKLHIRKLMFLKNPAKVQALLTQLEAEAMEGKTAGGATKPN